MTRQPKIIRQLLRDDRFDVTIPSFEKLVKVFNEVDLIREVVSNKKFSIHHERWYDHTHSPELLTNLIEQQPELFGKALAHVAISKCHYRSSGRILLVHAKQRPELFSAESIISLFGVYHSAEILGILLDKIQLNKPEIERIIQKIRWEIEEVDLYHDQLQLLLKKIRPDQDLISIDFIAHFSGDLKCLNMLCKYTGNQYNDLLCVLEHCGRFGYSFDEFKLVLGKIAGYTSEFIPYHIVASISRTACQDKLSLLLSNKHVRLTKLESLTIMKTVKKRKLDIPRCLLKIQ